MYIEAGIYFLLLIIGLCVGSFLNVVIYRIPLSLINPPYGIFNIAWPPSHCTNCNNKILKRDNIPVVSWVLLKGKCRFCGSVISSRYPIIEFTTGVIFSILGSYLLFNFDINIFFVTLFFFSVLLCLAIIDIDHLLLPDCLVFTLLWTGMLVSAFELSTISLKDAVIGVCGTWISLSTIVQLFTLIRKKEGLGGGDIKLISALAAWIGWYQIPLLLVFSSIIGGIMFITMKRKIVNNHGIHLKYTYVIPFGPAIALSVFFIYLLIINNVLAYK
ncbi:prepilin peptidase [Escherichia albertii]|uniref:prepilin peptidase n=1 Tax=Escherichia albertii TaxID=208962 RepID=UPI0007434F45|nr:A24 family peptidase [Escherichia albertii]